MFRDTYEDAFSPPVPAHDTGQPVQRRLLDARHQSGSSRCCGASATAWTAPACASSRPRASATSGSTRSRSCTTRRLVTCDNHSIYKTGCEGDRRPGGHEPDVHGEVRRARGQLVPHPPVAARRRRRAGVRRRRRRRPARLLAGVRAFPGRPAARNARADAVLRAEHQQLQAIRRGQLRADRHRVGSRQPHLRVAHRRPLAVVPSAWRTACQVPTRIPTSRSRR